MAVDHPSARPPVLPRSIPRHAPQHARLDQDIAVRAQTLRNRPRADQNSDLDVASVGGFREVRRGDESMRSIDDDALHMQDGALAAYLERCWVIVQVRETCSHRPVFLAELAPLSLDEV